MKLSVFKNEFPLKKKFTISRGSRHSVEVLTVKISKNNFTGWGECVPYKRYGETVDSVVTQIKNTPLPIDRESLQGFLSPGAARNAIDCALWDLEAKMSQKPVWEIAKIAKPKAEITAFTLSLEEPKTMREEAQVNSHRPILKIKLGGQEDLACLEAVKSGAPNSKIIVDANEAWDPTTFSNFLPHLKRLGVKMIEQPFAAGDDNMLKKIDRTIPICADESCHDRSSLESLEGKYDYVNIKLDKTGGLTEALKLRDAALKQGYKIMVGCMLGSSLGMAPAVLVSQNAPFVDLDGPLLLKKDRAYPLKYDDKGVHPPSSSLWG